VYKTDHGLDILLGGRLFGVKIIDDNSCAHSAPLQKRNIHQFM
jgi:hypothetical protein